MINWIKNYSKSTKKVTISNVSNFFVACYRYYFTNYAWKKAQAKWREERVKVKSPECITLGYCKNCYCDFPEKFVEPDGCEVCYPEWMNKEQWLDFINDK